jgi:hypothetical protein
MRILITAMLMFCCLVTSSMGEPNREECSALKKAAAEAQGAFSKANAKFSAANREYEVAWGREQEIQKSLDTNGDRIAVQQDMANDAAAALAACQQSDPSKPCVHEKNEKKLADARLQQFKERQAELLLDLAQARSWREQKEEALAAAHQDADMKKQALDAAIDATAGCKPTQR